MHARRRGETNVNTINHKLDRDPVNKLSLIIDVHSHVSLLGLFIVGNSYDDVYRCVKFIFKKSDLHQPPKFKQFAQPKFGVKAHFI